MKILNFGSLNIDHVYEVEKIVETGMTIQASRCSSNCGGKGLNQSVAMARGGATVSHAGVVGRDGTMLLQFLEACGVDTQKIVVTDGTTGHAIIQVDRLGNNGIIVLGGTNQQISKEMIDEILREYSAGDFIVLQNEISNVPYIIGQAHSKGMIVCFNPSPITDSTEKISFDQVDYLFVNEMEGAILSGRQDRNQIIDILTRHYPRCSVVLTLGNDGAIYAGPDGIYTQGIFETTVVDTTGAGDTFCGFFIAAVSQGRKIPEALELASKASSICVSRQGTAQSIPSIDEVMAGLKGGADGNSFIPRN